MNKIDKRKHYVLVVDTETANTQNLPEGGLDMSNVLVYDCGWAVCDTHGNIYLTRSFVNRDIFVHERRLMDSAYYGWKVPRYIQDIKAGRRIMADNWEIRKAMLEDMETFGITEVCAHNARFDVNALNNTLRWVTHSKKRYWFPMNTTFWDSLKMARSVMGEMPTYKKFCESNNYLTAGGKLRFTAEICYRFILNDNTFKESHTGLEDVLIESQIMAYCYKQHKPMKKLLWESEPLPQWTEFQIGLSQSMKHIPIIWMDFQ